MAEDNASFAAVTTHVEFTRSVDRDILQQICALNVQGLQALATAAGDEPAGRPTGIVRLESWAASAQQWRELSHTPFFLFEWLLPAAELNDGREPVRDDWRVNEPEGMWRRDERWQRFARIATYLTVEICRHRQAAARLLLGMPALQCERWAGLSLAQVDARAQLAAGQLDLRWKNDSFWQRRVQAVIAQEEGQSALWRNTLEGIQRLAVLGRSPS
jgi:hypothetical protein